MTESTPTDLAPIAPVLQAIERAARAHVHDDTVVARELAKRANPSIADLQYLADFAGGMVLFYLDGKLIDPNVKAPSLMKAPVAPASPSEVGLSRGQRVDRLVRGAVEAQLGISPDSLGGFGRFLSDRVSVIFLAGVRLPVAGERLVQIAPTELSESLANLTHDPLLGAASVGKPITWKPFQARAIPPGVHPGVNGTKPFARNPGADPGRSTPVIR